MSEIPHHSTEDRRIVAGLVDNPIFTDVTSGGEVYTTYRILRITHEFVAHPSGWTHSAEVTPLRSRGLFEALLDIRRRVVERSRIVRRVDQEDR